MFTSPGGATQPLGRPSSRQLFSYTPCRIDTGQMQQGSEPNTSSSVQGKPHPVASSVDGPRSKSADGWDAIAWLHRGWLSGFKIPRERDYRPAECGPDALQIPLVRGMRRASFAAIRTRSTTRHWASWGAVAG